MMRTVWIVGLLACDADPKDDRDTSPTGDDTATPDQPTDTGTPTDTGSTDTGTPATGWTGSAQTSDNGDGTLTTEVDATDQEGWTYVDLVGGGIVAADALTSGEWDLAFRRDAISVNGGSSGEGGVEAASLPSVPFESIAWPAAGGYQTDEPDADGDDVDELAFLGWYDYDYNTHTLSPADQTWVVRARSGEAYRLRFDSYYNTYDVSGHPTFTWGPLPDPGPLSATGEADGSITAVVDAVDDESWVYLELPSQIAVDPSDPQAAAHWQLALRRSEVKIGGGTSGGGGVEAAFAAGADFDALTTDPGLTFATDADTDSDGQTDMFALGDWYDYDLSTHTLSPKDGVYLLQDADGLILKLQFVDYYDQAGTGGVLTLRWATLTP